MIAIQLYTPKDGGWDSQPLELRGLPGVGHWILLRNERLKVRAVVHTGWDVEVYASADDFASVLNEEDE